MSEIRLHDYSATHPSAGTLRGAGSSGALRYLTRGPAPKRLTRAEATGLRTAGLWVGVVFEDGASRALAGHQAGLDDAHLAAVQATSIGIPTTCPIFAAVDDDLAWPEVAAYFRGWRDAQIPWPTGDYGSFQIVEGAAKAGVQWHWQCQAWSNDSRGRPKISPHAHLYQRNHFDGPTIPGTDENVMLKAIPLWGAPVTAKPAPKPVPKPARKPRPTPIPDPSTPAQEDHTMRLIHSPAHGYKLVTTDSAGLLVFRTLTSDEFHASRAAGLPFADLTDPEFTVFGQLTVRAATS